MNADRTVLAPTPRRIHSRPHKALSRPSPGALWSASRSPSGPTAFSPFFVSTVHWAVANRETQVVQPLYQVRYGHFVPGQPKASWIIYLRRILPADAVDASGDVRFGNLRRWTADAEPTPCINDDQAAVGVLDDASRMKIRVVRGDKILGPDGEAGPVPSRGCAAACGAD